MNTAERIRHEVAGVRAARELRSSLRQEYDRGCIAARQGSEVPDDITDAAEAGDAEALAWLEGYDDAEAEA